MVINPILHEYAPLWPIQVKSVHHFHRFWTFDTKIHDFVSFDVCQVPVKPFLTFFQKYLKNLALKNFGGPRACGKKLEKNNIFSIYWRKCWFCWLNLDSIDYQLSFEVNISIVAQIFKFFKFLVYKMSFLIFMIPGFIVVKVYYISSCFWFQWKYIDPKMYLKANFDQLLAFW